MPKDIKDLQFRIVPEEEWAQSPNKGGSKLRTVKELARKFIDPATEKPIEVGQKIEVGPFDSLAEGQNWLNYYLPDAYKDELLGWQPVNRRAPISKTVIERDGKFFFWLTREF